MDEKKKQHKTGIIILIVCICLALVGAGGYYLYETVIKTDGDTNKSGKEKDPTGSGKFIVEEPGGKLKVAANGEGGTYVLTAEGNLYEFVLNLDLEFDDYGGYEIAAYKPTIVKIDAENVVDLYGISGGLYGFLSADGTLNTFTYNDSKLGYEPFMQNVKMCLDDDCAFILMADNKINKRNFYTDELTDVSNMYGEIPGFRDFNLHYFISSDGKVYRHKYKETKDEYGNISYSYSDYLGFEEIKGIENAKKLCDFYSEPTKLTVLTASGDLYIYKDSKFLLIGSNVAEARGGNFITKDNKIYGQTAVDQYESILSVKNAKSLALVNLLDYDVTYVTTDKKVNLITFDGERLQLIQPSGFNNIEAVINTYNKPMYSSAIYAIDEKGDVHFWYNSEDYKDGVKKIGNIK